VTAFSPTDVAQQLGSGLLSFPVTHFAADHSFDETAYRENIGWLSGYDASGLFAAAAPVSSSPSPWPRSSRS
jgi:5-dehydro-4-deoxyglucarate dehydratase